MTSAFTARSVVRAIAPLILLALDGCSPERTALVLESALPADSTPRRLEVRTQVTGPTDGLRFKWFSVAGELDPQESDVPAAVFTFASGTFRDRISVEAWRGTVRVARSELDVEFAEPSLREPSPPRLELEITEVPPYEPDGGPNTRAQIAGVVRGAVSPDYRVIIYAHADAWYLQPTPLSFHRIAPDSSWRSWTHTGGSYAAMVVRPGFEPQARSDVLPPLGGNVLARAVVEGIRR
jgi:hypothetical protein